MVKITEETLWWIDTLLNLEIEACGVIMKKDCSEHDWRLFLDNVGKKTGRPSCVFKRYSKYIWHTHPRSSKGYPSAEDIAKTLKHSDIHTQFIFTDWGIWELYSRKHSQPNERIIKAINAEANALYNVTNRGRVLTKSNRHALNSYIEALTYNLRKHEFQITFIGWNELKRNSPYYSRLSSHM